MKKYPHFYSYLADVVQRHVSGSNPLIVDLGMGPGLLSLEIHKKIPGASIVGIDPELEMLKIAKSVKKESSAKFETILGAAEKIPMKSDFADIVVSRFTLPYWKKPEDGFAEILRVLKPGGKVILECLNKRFPRWKLSLIKLHMLLNFAGKNVVRYHIGSYRLAYTMKEVENFLQDADFTVVEKKGHEKDWRYIVVAEKKTSG
jgi:ubiquinone/menaquinone biosynthesis C-methylase UbiE